MKKALIAIATLFAMCSCDDNREERQAIIMRIATYEAIINNASEMRLSLEEYSAYSDSLHTLRMEYNKLK